MDGDGRLEVEKKIIQGKEIGGVKILILKDSCSFLKVREGLKGQSIQRGGDENRETVL